MKKYLYFGIFSSILCFQRKNDTQEMAIGSLLSIVDERNTCCHLIPRLKDIEKENKYNKYQISRVRTGSAGFEASEWCIVDTIGLEEVIAEIKVWAADEYYDSSSKERIILAIYDVIKEDPLIEIENQAVFKRYFGVNKNGFLTNDKIDFYELVARTLMYTVGVTIDKKVQKDCQAIFYHECKSYMMTLQKKYLNMYDFDANCLTWIN